MQEVSGREFYGYRFDDVTVDLKDFRVQKAGEARKITPRAFEVLAYLAGHQGRVVEKQELFEHIWRENFVSDNALTRVVKEIRQVIGDDAAAPRYIETVPKRGYRFVAGVEKLERENNGFGRAERPPPLQRPEKAGPNPAKPDENERGLPPPRSDRLPLFLAAALLLIVPLAVWLLSLRGPSSPAASFPSAGAQTTQLTNWSGLDNFPAISPDGNSVAYSSDRTGSFEIYVKPLAPGAKEIQITADGRQNFQPAWSPDGQRIAYYSKKHGGIWVVAASGGTAKKLTDFGSQPAFSPDGKQIVFQSAGLSDLGANARVIPPSTLWLVSSESGAAAGGSGAPPRQLTEPGNPTGGHGLPAWSPDGKRIAFNVADVFSSAIWSVDVAGGKLQQINTKSSDPVYASDGRSIYYVALNGLWQQPVTPGEDKASGEPVQIAEDGPAQIRNLSISADGKRLVYEMLMSASSLYALAYDPAAKTAGSEPSPLIQNSAARNTSPVHSPDGKRIAFNSLRAGSVGELWVMSADGSNPIQVASNATVSSWLSDSRRISFISSDDNRTRLWALNLDDGKQTPLFNFNQTVEFTRLSPDDRKVVFNARDKGTINIWLGNLASGEQRQLTFDPEFAGFPVWSPDGKWLAFQIKRGGTDDTHIAVMPAEGGEILQLTGEPGQSWVHSFSPDGDEIVFAGQRDEVWNIYTVSRATKEQKKLTNFDRLNSYVRYPYWSPLGDRIAFEYAETTGNIWMTQFK